MQQAAREQEFTPALGASWLTPFYDTAIAMLTREETWRRALIEAIDPAPGDRILDIGCGTGSLAVALARSADIVGIDPDPDILARAGAKAAAAGANVRFIAGFFSPEVLPGDWRPTKIVSSLVLHQTPVPEKKRIIGAIHRLLPPGGLFCLADYGAQPTAQQRFLFRQMVQRIDGAENTEPNALGVIDDLLAEAGFDGAAPSRVIRTMTGAISIWRAVRKPV